MPGEQGDSIGTGTTSDADSACKGDEKTVHFGTGGATGLRKSKETLSKEISWAQARLQMQIGHARATRKNVHFLQRVEGELPA